MSKIYSFFALALLASSFFGLQSCGKGASSAGPTDVTTRIPANASGVIVLNVGQLLSKVDYEKIKSTELFKRVLKTAPEQGKKVLSDLSSTGIDMKNKWAGFFATGDTPDDNFVAFILPLADATKWETITQEAEKETGNKPQDKKGYKALALEDEALLAWDKNIAVFVAPRRTGEPLTSAHEQRLDRIFKPEGDNIQKNAAFKKHFDENRDYLLWVTTDEAIQKALESPDGAQIKMAAGVLGISDDAFKGNSFAASVDFQNGKAEGITYYDFSPELQKKFGKIFRERQSQDYSKYLPAQNLTMVFGAALNLQELHTALAAMRMTNRFDNQLADLNLTSEEVLGALKGEGLIGLYKGATPDKPEFVFVAGVNNKTHVDKLIQATTVLRLAQVKGDRFEATLPPNQKVFGFIGSDVFAFSNNKTYIDKIAQGGFGAEAANHESIKVVESGWAGMAFLDFSLFADEARRNVGGYDADATVGQKVIDIIDNEIVSIAAVAQGNKATATATFTTKDKNVLARWAEIFEELYKIRMEARKSNKTVQ